MLLNKSNLAEHFGVSARTVERWMKHGCPHHKIGGAGTGKCVRFNLETVSVWLAHQQKGGMSNGQF